MREIKFRGWNKENKTMTPPFPIFMCTGDPECRYIFMQYTGLKDKNGKEIFEGDIVNWYIGGIEPYGIGWIVYGGHWEYAGFGIETHRLNPPNETGFTWDMLNPEYAKDAEVIGNIYENPELSQEAQ
jgi:uncharacterized phage protein (TIGR01671 family)